MRIPYTCPNDYKAAKLKDITQRYSSVFRKKKKNHKTIRVSGGNECVIHVIETTD